MANWPTSVSTNAQLYTAVNDKGTNLTASITNVDTTALVVDTTGFPSSGLISIEAEVISYSGLTGTSFTGLVRGVDGTTAASHANGLPVDLNVVAAHHNLLKDEIIAIESSLDLTASKAAITNASGRVTTSPTTSTEIAALNAKTADRALQTDGSGLVSTSTVTSTELGYVSGVTSAIQTQLNAKAADAAVVHLTGNESIAGTKTFTDPIVQNDTTNQLVLGVTNTTTISATAPSTSRTVTIPDPGANASFVMTEGTQTINGQKTLAAAAGNPIHGTNTNDSASAGYVGEYVESLSSTAVNSAADVTFDDLVSISLTAGDWDIWAFAEWENNGATWTRHEIGISTNSGNTSSGLVQGQNWSINLYASTSATNSYNPVIPPYRVSLSATTTYYLKRRSGFSAGTPRTTGGRLAARRIR